MTSARPDGCPDACPDLIDASRTLLVDPYRWEPGPDGARGFYRCPSCLLSWDTAWSSSALGPVPDGVS